METSTATDGQLQRAVWTTMNRLITEGNDRATRLLLDELAVIVTFDEIVSER